jgi:uncharacterized protein DUF1264
MGPYHHYCKVMAPDPQIVCLIYESTEPNARLAQVEWIYAEKLTRPAVSLRNWNQNWHDHAVEIAGGRVQVLDLPPDKAKEVADTVATTDGNQYCAGGRSQTANRGGIQSICKREVACCGNASSPRPRCVGIKAAADG